MKYARTCALLIVFYLLSANILGGGMKKKSSDSKLTSAVSHDVSDGLTGSKLLAAQLPDAGAAGNVVMRRAATIAVEDTDFDRVERGSILQDMRAGRVKVPKRRPPSVAKNRLGESNNNTEYVNGSGGVASSASELSEDGGIGRQATATASSDDNSTGGEEPQLVKPKPRDWEKKKAPWMEELKASQVTRKKTSPNVEPRGGAMTSVAERTSKLFATEQVNAASSVLTTSATSSSTNSSSISTSATKVQSSAVTSSSVQQYISVESSSSSSSQKKECTSSSSTNIVTSNNNHNDAIMSKSSVSASKATGSAATAAAGASSDEESRAARPSTLAIRKRSVSPLVKTSNTNATSSSTSNSSTLLEKSNNISINDGATTALQNNHQPAATVAAAVAGTTATTAEAAPRVQQLEGRVDKLEAMVLGQQRTIEELMRLLREETERVKVLRGELDKYAQCVTQV